MPKHILAIVNMYHFGMLPADIPESSLINTMPPSMRASHDKNRNISPMASLHDSADNAKLYFNEWLAESELLVHVKHTWLEHIHPSGRVSYVIQDMTGTPIVVASITSVME